MSSELYDITIVGAGPAGLLLSVQLARWGYKIKHIDNRAEPTDTGRADGIQPRTLDLLKNMGFKRQLMAHGPARVYEVAFWESGALGKGIRRTGTWANCPKFIDSRHPYTTLLHQGYIERILIADLEGNGTTIQRPWRIVDFRSTRESKDYRVEVEIAHMETGESQKLRSKYLFSGEGAKSLVREKLGIKMLHKDPITHVWGVIDGVVHTDFPDIRVRFPTWMSTVTESSDEMYYSLGSRFHHDHSKGEQHGQAVRSACIFDRQRLEHAQEGASRRCPNRCKENFGAI